MYLYSSIGLASFVVTDSFVDVHSDKNLSNLRNEFISLNSTITHLESFNDSYSNQCSSILENEYNNLKIDLSNVNIISADDHRVARGIRQLGTIVSWLTDVPSPDEWDRQKLLISNLEKAVNSESNEMLKIENIMKNESFLISKINSITRKNQNNEIKMSEEIAQNRKTEIICMFGQSLTRNMRSNINNLIQISNDARFNLPNRSMFPPKIVLERTKTFLGTYPDKKPFFESESDMNVLYGMNSAVTTFKFPKVHSVLSVPLVEHDFEKPKIQVTIRTHDNPRFLPFQKLTNTVIDKLLCSSDLRFSTLFSSDNFRKCQHSFTNDLHICERRKISLINQTPNLCLNHDIPKVIVVQKGKDSFLIEGNAGSTHLKCMHNVTSRNISKLTEIRVPPECSLENEYFIIHKYPNLKAFEITTKMMTFKAKEYDYSIHEPKWKVHFQNISQLHTNLRAVSSKN